MRSTSLASPSAKLLFSLALSLIITSGTHAEVIPGFMLVIDQGVDFSHQILEKSVRLNLVESQGNSGIDDDTNGFVDDTAGWNGLSNDPVFMPDHVMKVFTDDMASAEKAFDLYGRMESGDEAAKAELLKNRPLLRKLGRLLNLSHGTHVAGIVLKNSRQSAKLQSLNVFEASTPTPVISNILVPASVLQNHFLGTNNLSKNFLSMAMASSPSKPSFLDDRDQLVQELKEAEAGNFPQYKLFASYVAASKASVANLSLGTSKAMIMNHLEKIWQQERLMHGESPSKPKSTQQLANFMFLVDGMFAINDRGWQYLFRQNPDVLFVVAAGNDGSSANMDLGDLEKNPGTPAIDSAVVPNVLTVAATTPDGVLADFSDHGSKFVNIGAWGTAVPSQAPAKLSVKMSGTSMAAPLVAGVAVQMRLLNPSLSPGQVRAIIERTGKVTASLTGRVSSNAMIDPTAAFDAAIGGGRGVDLSDAITDAVRRRDMAMGARFLRSDLGSLNLGGELIHKTSELSKHFLRSFDLF